MRRIVLLVGMIIPFVAMAGLETLEAEPYEIPREVRIPAELKLPADTILISYSEYLVIPGSWLYTGQKYAVQFTPPSYPFELLAIGYLAYDFTDHDNDYDVPCDLVVFADGETPGAEIGRLNNAQQTEPLQVAFFDATLLDITINSGSFYCAVENTQDTFPVLAMDIESPVHRRGWMYADVGEGNAWYPFSELISPDYPDMSLADTLDPVIQVIGVTSGGIVELEPDVTEIAPTVAIVASQGTINYILNEPGNVEITLWDGLGRKASTLFTGYSESGEHSLSWDSTDLPRGAYFIHLSVGNLKATSKVVLVD
ncbi:T9SS type A sorting domain-containing protein [candidate division WOR-3 bacterium]|uniref:T9SS type A sorting domain-containing protein n=1 Tax=candidate division WOR-3 bacterium TaxID=2052148 RepID=A0A9D5K9U2_UNCW3|nr:T9SS type A sorting domain-containing protein [candidate division WOR-3 bacterium]MBD3365056.1 T9SS type A sorting domain-containing protein [candidate division WOR-3 bacterium]